MLLEVLIFLVAFPVCLMILLAIIAFVLVPGAFMAAAWYSRAYERKAQRRARDGANVAFFHPYCNAGGGGERVLWVAIKALLTRYPNINIYIYTVDTATPQAIVDKVHNQFNVSVDVSKLKFVRLVCRRAIEDTSYPVCTLLLQGLGSMVLGMEAFMKFNPDVYIDTTGHAFTYPIFRYLARARVGCYTHYPTVTRSMARRVQRRVPSHNNRGAIARNPVLTWCKLQYYSVLGWLYGLAGRCAHVVMVNSSWTEEHVRGLWGGAPQRVFPPCEVTELKKLRSLVKESDPIRILSVAQFRPEKDHPLMLQALYELRTLLARNELLWGRIKLVLAGACRNAADAERVQHLRDLARHLALEDSVEFVVNAPYARLLALYQTCSIGLHAMWNEHFGISVVECMAAGLVVVAHRSGGPRADIVQPARPARNGLLAAAAPEYARALLEAIALAPHERRALVDAARASVDRFSTAEFEKAFLRAAEPLLQFE